MPPFRDGAPLNAEVQRLRTLILRSVARLNECLRLMRQAMALQATARRQLHRQSWPHGDQSDTADLADLADARATGDEDALPSGPADVAELVGIIVRGPWPEGVVVRGPWRDSGES
jgi:hypothetical protein